MELVWEFVLRADHAGELRSRVKDSLALYGMSESSRQVFGIPGHV